MKLIIKKYAINKKNKIRIVNMKASISFYMR